MNNIGKTIHEIIKNEKIITFEIITRGKAPRIKVRIIKNIINNKGINFDINDIKIKPKIIIQVNNKAFSPTKIIANLNPLYSVLNPLTNSLSASK